MFKEFVNFVAKHLMLTNILKKPAVQSHVGEVCLGKKVKSIQPIGKADVYCLVVPETHNFIANGMVVHNSVDSLRYCLYTHFFGKDGSKLSANDVDRLYAESRGAGYNLPAPFRSPEEIQNYQF